MFQENRTPLCVVKARGGLALLTALVALGTGACGGGQSAVAPMARTPDNIRTEAAVLVQFEARSSETWSLRRADESVVCRLPCRYWVDPANPLTVQLERYDRAELSDTSYVVPAYLPGHGDEVLTVSVDRTHGLGTMGKYIAAPLGAVFSLMGGSFLGIGIASLATGSENTTTSVNGGVNAGVGHVEAESNTSGVAASVTSIAVGVGGVALAALCWVWFAHDRSGKMEMSLREEGPRARLHLLPAGVAVETKSTRGVVTPLGAQFTF
ncbi:hypothetical protein [Chondromyces crocatus]|nr:hypothetical protein [Chondromyces crocatus]